MLQFSVNFHRGYH